MNKAIRKELDEVIATIELALDKLEAICDGEQEKYENLPENLMYSDRGTALQEVVIYLDEASNSLDNALDSIRDAQQ